MVEVKDMALLLLAVAAATPSAPPKNLFWCSWAGPNQTLTLGGADPPLPICSGATCCHLLLPRSALLLGPSSEVYRI